MRKLIGLAMAFAMLGTLMAGSVAMADNQHDVQVDANNATILELDLSQSTFSFGNVAPDGSVDQSGTLRKTDSAGAYYCTGPISATVHSNVVYDVNWGATHTSGGNMDLSNLGGAADCAVANPAAGVLWGPAGSQQYAFPKFLDLNGQPTLNSAGQSAQGSLWLRSLWSNTPGAFGATLTVQLVVS